MTGNLNILEKRKEAVIKKGGFMEWKNINNTLTKWIINCRHGL